MRRILLTLLFATALVFPAQAVAWDYLEHAWFSDVSCNEAQSILAKKMRGEDDELASRYVALSLFCPMSWEKPYCIDGNKMARGALNETRPAPPDGGYAITLGDFSALGDHVTRYGPMPRMERALDDGILMRTMEWVTRPPSTAGGLIEDVAEDACETSVADFRGARGDIDVALKGFRDGQGYPQIDERLLQPGLRKLPKKGPSDPAARYSFNNPHYLDMVVRNHTHFGHEAYEAWLGFHSAALNVARRECAEVVPLDDDLLDDLADDFPAWEDFDWESVKGEARAQAACGMFADAMKSRVAFWASNASPELVAPVGAWIAGLQRDDYERIFVASLAQALEGTGLHFLQDGLASGHMRTIRSREALADVRYDHDSDNAHGVTAQMATKDGVHRFFAYGDTYLLAPSHIPGCMLSWDGLSRVEYLIPEMVTACTIQHQRGLLTAAAAASLVDFALDGPAFESTPACPPIQTAEGWICRTLPMHAPATAGTSLPRVRDRLMYGTLPVPPPEYSYESLSFRVGLEIESNSPQIGLVLSFLDALGTEGHWLTNWRFGLTTTLGDNEDNQWIIDASYHFHYRLSARFMIDMGPFWFVGLRDLDEDVEFVAGIGPSVGITALPEGWMRIPLELSITYQVPLTILASKSGFFADDVVEDHWLQFGVGLAFSH